MISADGSMKSDDPAATRELGDYGQLSKTLPNLLVFAGFMAVTAYLLYLLSIFNFQLYHFAIETMTVIVAVTITSIGWHTRRYATSPVYLIIAVGYFLVGTTDLLHLIFFKGLNLVQVDDHSEKVYQLWLVARFIEAVTFSVALLLPGIFKGKREKWPIAVLLVLWVPLMVAVYLGVMPEMLVEGRGTTAFLDGAVYTSMALLGICLYSLWHRAGTLRRADSLWMGGSIILIIASDFSTTFYTDTHGLMNYFGHFFKLGGYVLLYRSLVIGSLAAPYRTLFLELSDSVQDSKRATKAALDANHEKSAFIASVSHEIRTPMNSVIGLTSLLLGTNLTPLQRRYVSMARESATTLLGLINQILEYSKLEEHKMQLSDAPFLLRDVTDGVVEMFSLSRQDQELKVISEVSPDLPPVLWGDAPKLRQVLINLMGNSVKFTRRGRVTLSARLLEMDNPARIEFSVSDTGPGIQKEDLPRIFIPYEQKGEGSHKKVEGTGLGLAISKHIVEMMGGAIDVSSKIGEGTTFTFNAPFKVGSMEDWQKAYAEAECSQQLGKSEEISDFTGLRALVADDNEINRIVTKELMEKRGFAVEVVENGQEALEAATYDSFDLVLMDMRMPVMDGLEATRKIREAGVQIPIVGLTAAAFNEDRDMCLKAGMNSYLSKPIEPNEFFKVLSGLLKRNQPAALPEKEEAIAIDGEFAQLKKIFANNPPKFIEIANLFLGDCRQHKRSLETAFNKEDWAFMGDVAHALRGCLTVFGSVRAATLTKDLELALREGDREGAALKFEELKAELGRMDKLLKAEIDSALKKP